MFAKQSDWTPVMRPVVTIICLLTVYSLAFGTDPGEIKKETRPKDDVATNKDKPRFPDLDHSWTNSVGMEFLPVPGVKVLFSKYETTNKDFRHFRPNHDSGKFKGDSLNDDRQPVVNVSWNDARD